MISKIQNNSNKPSFGMSYASTKNVAKTHWASELEKAGEHLTESSKNVIAIFTKADDKNLDCYSFKPSKMKFINTLQEKFPDITLKTRRFMIWSKNYFFEKHSDFGFSGSQWLRKDKSVCTILDKSVIDLERRTKLNKDW